MSRELAACTARCSKLSHALAKERLGQGASIISAVRTTCILARAPLENMPTESRERNSGQARKRPARFLARAVVALKRARLNLASDAPARMKSNISSELAVAISCASAGSAGSTIAEVGTRYGVSKKTVHRTVSAMAYMTQVWQSITMEMVLMKLESCRPSWVGFSYVG